MHSFLGRNTKNRKYGGTNPVWKKRSGTLLESMHTGQLQPCYATGVNNALTREGSTIYWLFGRLLIFGPPVVHNHINMSMSLYHVRLLLVSLWRVFTAATVTSRPAAQCRCIDTEDKCQTAEYRQQRLHASRTPLSPTSIISLQHFVTAPLL